MRGLVIAFLIFTFGLSSFAAWEFSASIRGRLMAQFDVLRGRYEVLAVGKPAASRPEFARLLRERYGIELRVVAGCGVTDSLLAYVDGYNTVSASAANRRFGHNVFEEVAIDARRNWKLQQRRAIP